MAKSRLKIEARKMRAEGKSIKDIARNLGVSSSTASLWCRDVKLSQKQVIQLEKNSKDPFYGRRLSYSLKQQLARKVKEEQIKSEARSLIENLSDREKLIAGTALYWAEGFKKDKMVGFANTDPEMITFILNKISIIQTAGGGADTGALAGIDLESIFTLFSVELMIPPYFLQIIIGIYIIQVVLILTGALVVVDSGKDPLKEKYELTRNLRAGMILYLIVSTISLLSLSILATVALSGLG